MIEIDSARLVYRDPVMFAKDAKEIKALEAEIEKRRLFFWLDCNKLIHRIIGEYPQDYADFLEAVKIISTGMRMETQKERCYRVFSDIMTSERWVVLDEDYFRHVFEIVMDMDPRESNTLLFLLEEWYRHIEDKRECVLFIYTTFPELSFGWTLKTMKFDKATRSVCLKAKLCGGIICTDSCKVKGLKEWTQHT